MKEISQSDYLLKSKKKLNVKMSNMNMNISIDFSNIKDRPKNGLWIEKVKLEKPSDTHIYKKNIFIRQA